MSRAVKRERLIPISIYEIDPSQDVRFRLLHRMDSLITTAATLGALAVYSSAVVQVDAYQKLVGEVIADQDGEFLLKFSYNGTNFDSEDLTSVYANQKYSFDVEPLGSYCQVVYTNGATPQGLFRINIMGEF